MSEALKKYKSTIEGILFASDQPMTIDKLLKLFEGDEEQPEREELKSALKELQEDYQERGVELVEVASGYQFRVQASLSPWLQKMWEERPPRYTRALLETLSLIAYRQPITRGEIEAVRGVAVSSNIIRTLLEREWVRVVGFKDVPGRPSLYATTKQFLDHFNLKSLKQLPPLAELTNFEEAGEQLELEVQGGVQVDAAVDDAEADVNEEPEVGCDEEEASVQEVDV